MRCHTALNREDNARAERMGLKYSMFGLDTPPTPIVVGFGQHLVDPEAGEEITALESESVFGPRMSSIAAWSSGCS